MSSGTHPPALSSPASRVSSFADHNAFWLQLSRPTADNCMRNFYTIWYYRFSRGLGRELGGTRYPGELPTGNLTEFLNPPTKKLWH
jgi:hypothetical protein